MDKNTNQHWHHLHLHDVERMLNTSFRRGLSLHEVELRQQNGKNILPSAGERSWISLLFRQFRGPFGSLLLLATAVSYFLGERTDALIIFAAILLNVLSGFLQELKAQTTLRQLKKLVTLYARVLRDGEEQKIPTAELVPGDIVIIEEGDRVPADMRIVRTMSLKVNEAILTGESESVEKTADPIEKNKTLPDQTNRLFAGTHITQGHAVAVVTEIGNATEIGKIQEMLKKIPEELSPLQKKFSRLSWHIGLIAMVSVVLIFFIGIAQGNDILSMFKTALSVGVAAIPEGLLVTTTIILALGMKRMAKEKAVVRHPAAAEILGSTTVICTDKTGTLTEGIMKVAHVAHLQKDLTMSEIVEHPNFETTIKICLLCNNARTGYEGDQEKTLGEPTEAALLEYGEENGYSKERLEEQEPRIGEVPFRFDRKYMATLHQTKGKSTQTAYFKGAPERVLEHSTHILIDGEVLPLTFEMRQAIAEANTKRASEGLRNLGLAMRIIPPHDFNKIEEAEKNLIFVSLISLHDPIRLYVNESVDTTQKAGVRIVMITGDHAATAQNIARQLGLPAEKENILDGEVLSKLSLHELRQRIHTLSVYARVSPKDKLRIIRAWQEEGAVVAMTGDGVNDTPALKAADIGVSLGSATELAKETADIVLLDDNFRTIAASVEEGRVIFDNIKKVVSFMLGTNLGEVLVIFLSLVLQTPLPLLAAQIIWVNLVSDGLPNIALTGEPKEDDVMKRKPRLAHEPLLDSSDFAEILYVGIIVSAVTLGFFFYALEFGETLLHTRTMTFTLLSCITLAAVVSYRSLRSRVTLRKLFTNRYLVGAIAISLLLQIAGVTLPFLQKILETTTLRFVDWLIIVALSILAFFLIELRKFLWREKKMSRN